MDIEEKLVLSARPGKITLIREGYFLRCYQQSLFSLVRQAYPEIRIMGRAFKKLNGRVVYYAGFPHQVLEKVLPGSVLTPWGAEADCNVLSEDDYQLWQATLSPPTPASIKRKSETSERTVVLTDEMARFLRGWQPGCFPASVDAGFILGLKQLWGLSDIDA